VVSPLHQVGEVHVDVIKCAFYRKSF